MKGKNGVKLADFIREIINTKISEKPVKSRIFEDFEGIRKAPPRLLLSGRPEVQILLATPDNPPKTQYLCGFSVFFIFEILFDFGKRLEFSAKTSSFLIEIFKTSRQMVC